MPISERVFLWGMTVTQGVCVTVTVHYLGIHEPDLQADGTDPALQTAIVSQQREIAKASGHLAEFVECCRVHSDLTEKMSARLPAKLDEEQSLEAASYNGDLSDCPAGISEEAVYWGARILHSYQVCLATKILVERDTTADHGEALAYVGYLERHVAQRLGCEDLYERFLAELLRICKGYGAQLLELVEEREVDRQIFDEVEWDIDL